MALSLAAGQLGPTQRHPGLQHDIAKLEHLMVRHCFIPHIYSLQGTAPACGT